ncbi:hypothetical protein [Fortiea sp. LEGE XX443]|uniref:hypothetical protein n=1 Tax=Fortiea sp. LEGE XX443 TaxID=1828611 RepID=UPI0018817535|nr:hypothetical protein [Fortiea sp. LEGE XX443]
MIIRGLGQHGNQHQKVVRLSQIAIAVSLKLEQRSIVEIMTRRRSQINSYF